MLFFSFFKTLVNHEVTVELKNDISIRGTLKSVDQYLNIKLDDITVVEEVKYPHLVSRDSRRKRERARGGKKKEVCGNWWYDVSLEYGESARRQERREERMRSNRPRDGAMVSSAMADRTAFTELGQECLHPRQCRAIRPLARIISRHSAFGGCHAKRYDPLLLSAVIKLKDGALIQSAEASQAQAKAKQG